MSHIQKGTPISLSADFSAETLQLESGVFLSAEKGKTYSLGYSTEKDYNSELKRRQRIPQTSKN